MQYKLVEIVPEVGCGPKVQIVLDFVLRQSLKKLILDTCLGRWQQTQTSVYGSKEWIGIISLTERTPKVIQIQSPNHGSAKTLLLQEVDLLFNRVEVVEADPLIALVGIGSHPILRITNNCPAFFGHLFADLFRGR
jgi:hypothetical protein